VLVNKESMLGNALNHENRLAAPCMHGTWCAANAPLSHCQGSWPMICRPQHQRACTSEATGDAQMCTSSTRMSTSSANCFWQPRLMHGNLMHSMLRA
jgi:hypothetical protein